MWKKGINFVFVGLILCGLLLGLARTVFFPKKINYYENRYANRAALPTPGTYADGTFQDQLEAALGDQTPFAEHFKARYNDLSSKLTKALLKPVLESGRYYRIGDVQLFSDYLTYHTRDLQVLRPTLEERAANCNAIFAAHPDIEFFVCYIEKDTDINFETGERVYADDLLFSMLNLPENRMLKYEIPDFAAFSEYFTGRTTTGIISAPTAPIGSCSPSSAARIRRWNRPRPRRSASFPAPRRPERGLTSSRSPSPSIALPIRR